MTRPHAIDRPARAPEESLSRLLRQLAHAVAWSLFRRLPIRVVDRLITGCALVALGTPLLLWVSWSRWGLLIVLSIGMAAIGLCALLVFLYPDDPY